MLRTGTALVIALALTLPWASVQGQESKAVGACLSADEVKSLLDRRAAWKYYRLSQSLEQATCVSREGSILRVTWPEGGQAVLQWVGKEASGHWYDIPDGQSGVTSWDLRTWEGAGVERTTVTWVHIRLSPGEWLILMKFNPPFNVKVRRGAIRLEPTEYAIRNCTCPEPGQARPTIFLLSKPNRQMSYQWLIPSELGQERTLGRMLLVHAALIDFFVDSTFFDAITAKLAAASATQATADDGKIVAGNRIGNVSLDMSIDDATKLLGTASRAERTAAAAIYDWQGSQIRIVQALDTGRISSIRTFWVFGLHNSYRTEQGLGIGATEAQVKQAYGGTGCFVSEGSTARLFLWPAVGIFFVIGTSPTDPQAIQYRVREVGVSRSTQTFSSPSYKPCS